MLFSMCAVVPQRQITKTANRAHGAAGKQKYQGRSLLLLNPDKIMCIRLCNTAELPTSSAESASADERASEFSFTFL